MNDKSVLFILCVTTFS